MAKKVIAGMITVLLVLYFVTLVLHISARYTDYQWDFRTHRKAGEIFASGKNPYDPNILLTQEDASFLYTYPPVTLFFYNLFARTPYKTAFHIFLVLKCILLVGLIYLWRREFLKQASGPFFYLFCLLAFNAAVYRDFIAGNINLVEQVLLWLAFWFFLKRKLVWYCIFCLAAASFKMTPIFFLVLLLFSDDNKKYVYFAGSAGAFLAYLLVQYIVAPELFSGFIRNALIVVSERGTIAPSTFTLLSDIFKWLSKTAGITVPQAIPFSLFLVFAAAVVFWSYKAYLRLQRLNPEDKECISLFLICLVYALIHPRFKDYAHMLLLPPAFYIIKSTRFTAAAPFIFFLSILVYPPFIVPGTEIIFNFFWKYYALMVVYTIWGMYLYEIFSLSKNQNARG
jgi:hypothetical protein